MREKDWQVTPPSIYLQYIPPYPSLIIGHTQHRDASRIFMFTLLAETNLSGAVAAKATSAS